MSDPNYTDADLIAAHNDLLAQKDALEKEQAAQLKPYTDGINAIKAEMLQRLQERKAKNTKVEGVGTAYQQTTLSVKVDNHDAFLAWILEAPSTPVTPNGPTRWAFLDVGVLKDPVKAWFDAVDVNGQPLYVEAPPGLKHDWFTKCNIRRT